jgi:hypothetical protein
MDSAVVKQPTTQYLRCLQFASMRWPWAEDIVTQAGTGLLDRFGMSYKMEPTNAFTLSCSTSSLRITTSLLTTASYQRNGGAELPPPPRRYALSKPGHLPSSTCHTILSSTRASPGRKRLWRVTSGRLSAVSASDRHRRGWSTKSA